MKFEGIPAGRLSLTPLPNVVFSELLPLMDDLAEVKVVLHVFYLLTHKKGSPRYVTSDELRADTTLMRSLEYKPEQLERGLGRAVAHGALLPIEVNGTPSYLFNTAESRRTLEKIQAGELELGASLRVVEAEPAPPPNIFKLYELHIGALSPLIAEELIEAEQEYPPEVIRDAFRIAAENNARSWKYVRAVLSDWTRGKKHETTGRPPARERRPRITGKLAGVAKNK